MLSYTITSHTDTCYFNHTNTITQHHNITKTNYFTSSDPHGGILDNCSDSKCATRQQEESSARMAITSAALHVLSPTFYLASILTFCLAFYLTFYLTFFLTYFLAYLLTLSAIYSKILSIYRSIYIYNIHISLTCFLTDYVICLATFSLALFVAF